MTENQSTTETAVPPNKVEWWWLAVNGASCAACFLPIERERLQVSPNPEQLIGFRTSEEQRNAQSLLLEAPIEEVRDYMRSLRPRIDAGEVAYFCPKNPEPPTRGQTMWSIGPKNN